MEALIYDESPLANYLEGDAAPFEPTPNTPLTPPQYAPTGLPKVRDRLRALRDTATSVANLADERFLERFRYTIVASQLLSDDSKPRARPPNDDPLNISLSLRGALFTTGLSFMLPWLVHWVRSVSRDPIPTSWGQILLYIAVATGALVFLSFALRRQYSRFVRQSAVSAASKFVSESHNFDTTTSAALRYVQEVEVVARGYQLCGLPRCFCRNVLTLNRSHPLPPISRLDDKHVARQCRELRSLIARSLTTSLTQFVYFHNDLQPFVNMEDLHSYYNIYEISTEDFSGAVNFANDLSADAQETLKQLRFLSSLHSAARKLLLIDLIALRPRPSWSDIYLWRRALRILQTLSEDSAQMVRQLQEALNDQDLPEPEGAAITRDGEGVAASTTVDFSATPSKQQSKTQIRRFDAIANAVRSLNAKVRIARDDMSDLIANDAGEATVSSIIAKHYDYIGSDLRSLLVDWERGRDAMALAVDSERSSRPSSSVRSPISPSPSLGGVTMVDGGPADALRLLNGEDDTKQGSLQDTLDEEVFEAVAKPRKRMSLAFSREEKMAKLQEDRRKRATLQEQAETTTNMLRELQMVIKHRPSPSQNQASIARVTSV